MKLTESQVNLAVDWWTKALENPKFQTLRPDDTEPGSMPARMAEVMAKASHEAPADTASQAFGEALREILETQEDGYNYLSVDYGPCSELREALEKAGLRADNPSSVLPWKTIMRFEDGGVQVACGYGEPFVELSG